MTTRTFLQPITLRDFCGGVCTETRAILELTVDPEALARHVARQVFRSRAAAVRIASGSITARAHNTRRARQ